MQQRAESQAISQRTNALLSPRQRGVSAPSSPVTIPLRAQHLSHILAQRYWLWLESCVLCTMTRTKDGEFYTLNMDNSVTRINKMQDGIPIGLLPSASNQKNITDSVLKYRYNLVKSGNVFNINDLMSFGDCFSIVRVYKDIFLTYYQCIKSWVLFRIFVP